MHNQRRGETKTLDAGERAALDSKIASFRELYTECFDMRHADRRDRECFPLQERLLRQNPECYTVWGHRRTIYEYLWTKEEEVDAAITKDTKVEAEGSAESADDARQQAKNAVAEQKRNDVLRELKFNTEIVMADYKCYAAFLHRRWILKHLEPRERAAILLKENAKLEELMLVDERNFHVWGYRRFVIDSLKQLGHYTHQQDLRFAAAKINKTFSNYSAWHCRGLVLNRMLDGAALPEQRKQVAQLVEEGLDAVLKACYCDPADQSTWIFALGQLDLARRFDEGGQAQQQQHGEGASPPLGSTVAEGLLEASYELLEDETALSNDAAVKWPLLTVVHCAERGFVDLAKRPVLVKGDTTQPAISTMHDAYTRLQLLDPRRAGYYRDRKAALPVVA